MSELDEIMKNLGLRNIGQTPSLNKNDDDSNRNFYDYVLNSVEFHNYKTTKKFKDLEFIAVVLHADELVADDLSYRTSPTFENLLATKAKIKDIKETNHKLYEVYAHIPEISGILPQPTQTDSLASQDSVLGSLFIRKCKRFPRFYHFSDANPSFQFGDMVKIKFVDENFMYYGSVEEVLTSGHTNPSTSAKPAKDTVKTLDNNTAANPSSAENSQGY